MEQGTSPSRVIEISTGKIRGITEDKIHIFKGLPYGGAAAGRNRFLPPTPPCPWAGVREVLDYGPTAFQLVDRRFVNNQRLPAQSEDCLVLNVWTPGLDDGRKRPVMVWLHGGGFQASSGAGSMTDGTNLARKGDVVIVSVNHRLNVFGFLCLAEFASKEYAESANAGMLDLVAALLWIRENIGVFGGDPGNVTIFGESGGAGKVSTLMAMPSAKGLFHRAIAASGAMPKVRTREDASQTAEELLAYLGLRTSQADELQRIPADHLIAACNAITKPPFTPGSRMIWAPVVTGCSLPGQPFDPFAPTISADVPIIIGTNKTEISLFTTPDAIHRANLREQLMKSVELRPDDADRLIEVYAACRPNVSAYDIFVAIVSDVVFRMPSIAVAERKEALRTAPVYMYLFEWETPVMGGHLKTPHALDVPFVFANVDKVQNFTGTGADRYPLQDQMSSAWIAFARNGIPNHSTLPLWAPYTCSERGTMIFNNHCQMVNDPNQADRLSLSDLPLYEP